MIKLKWVPAKACAPDAAEYAGEPDRLLAEDGGDLQPFPRQQSACPLPSAELSAALDAWLATRTRPADPVPVMVHGYQYDPTNYLGGGADDPYHLVYGRPGSSYGSSGTPLDYHQSWLPLVGECSDDGSTPQNTAVAFAWVSEGSLQSYADACWPSDYPYAALDLAPRAARALAAVLGHLGARHVPLRILAHSLGTRTFTQAVSLLRQAEQPLSIDRVVLLGASEFCVDAAAAFSGCDFDIVSLASRVDLVLLGGAGNGCHPFRRAGLPSAMVVGREGLGAHPRWLDLQLDDDRVPAWFRSGYAPTGKHYLVNAQAEGTGHHLALLNHWAYYMNDGNRDLVRDLLLSPDMTVDRLIEAHAPRGVDSVMYGQFNGLEIPPTPDTCGDRQQQVAQNDFVGGGAA